MELEHEGTIGRGEAAPVYYRGETTATATAFLSSRRPSPTIRSRSRRSCVRLDGDAAGRAALDAALHDWVGRRLGVPVWRLLGLSRNAPVTSYTLGIDTLEGTRDRARRAAGFRALKVKVGGAEDLARLEAVRAESDAPLRVDANEGWTLEQARELVPALVELGVELIEQPFPADDLESFRALRELSPRPPVIVDEGCHDLGDVAAVAGYADGINVKLAKSGGLREAVRMVHAARALGLSVMIGCMVESQLGVAPAAADRFAGGLGRPGRAPAAGRRALPRAPVRGRAACCPRTGPGWAWSRRVSEKLAIFAEGLFAAHNGKTAHGVIRYGTRDVVAVIDSTQAGRTAAEVVPFSLHPVPIVATLGEAIELGATALLIGVAPTGGKLDRDLARAAARGDRRRPGRGGRACTPSCPRTPSCAGPPRAPGWRCATCARRRPT